MQGMGWPAGRMVSTVGAALLAAAALGIASAEVLSVAIVDSWVALFLSLLSLAGG